MASKKDFSTMRFFCGSSHPELGGAVAKQLGVQQGNLHASKFTGGETYVRIKETTRGYDTFVLQTTGASPNDDYMELFIMMDALKRSSAKSINVIIPYFGYSRQDKKSAPREPISARLIADLLSAVGFNRLITMDLHADQIQGFFSVPVDHITAFPLFETYFAKKKIPNLTVVAPDTGRAKFAKKLSDRLGAELAIMHKTRPKQQVAEITNIVGDVSGRNVLLVDDMIDTAGSVTSCVEALKKAGCKDLYLSATHAIFSGPAIERLSKAGFKEVVVTDTVPIQKEKQFKGLKVLSTAPLFAEVIRRNHLRLSISPLFD